MYTVFSFSSMRENQKDAIFSREIFNIKISFLEVKKHLSDSLFHYKRANKNNRSKISDKGLRCLGESLKKLANLQEVTLDFAQ